MAPVRDRRQRGARKLCSVERTVTVVEIIRLESSEQVIDSIEIALARSLARAPSDSRGRERGAFEKNDNTPTSREGGGEGERETERAREKRRESPSVIRLTSRVVLFRLNRKPLCGEVSRETRRALDGGRRPCARAIPRSLYWFSDIRNGNYEAIKRGNADLLDRMGESKGGNV